MMGARLGVGDSGEDVARLHQFLQRVGIEVSTEEVRRRLFGPATLRAVRTWQSENHLDPTGLVDQQTVPSLEVPPPASPPPTASTRPSADRDTDDRDGVVDGASPGSEYERYVARLRPLLADIPLRDATVEDLASLAGDTGIPMGHLAGLAEAARRSAAEAAPDRPTLPIEVWYAWQRIGIDTDPVKIWQRPVDELATSLQAAVDRGVAPAGVSDRIEELRPHIRALRLDHLLDRPPVRGGGSLRDLLASAPEGLSVRDQQAVAEVLADRRPTPDRLTIDLAKAGLAASTVETVVRTMRLAELTDGHPPLVAALQPLAGGTSLRELADLAPESWLDLAYQHGVHATPQVERPPDPDPVSPNLDPAGYAGLMLERVEALHPTATLRARLDDGSVGLAMPGGDLVGPFLAANSAFDVVTMPIEQFLDELPSSSVPDRSRLASALRTVQRLQAVTSTWDEVDALIDAGLRSSAEIAAVEPAQLAAALNGRVSWSQAHAISSRAATVQDTTTAIVGTLRAASAEIVALPIEEPSGSVLEKYPSLRSLFGPLEGCACGHCRSVLGPAAYLVDLLEFLRLGSSQAFATLLERRPDLADLELSCENSQREIPAIDLSLEILENAVALPLTVALPPGTDVTAALKSDPLPPAVVAVLSRTAPDVGSHLRATREPQELQHRGFTSWTVADQARRWILHQTDEALKVSLGGFGRLDSVPVSVAGLDLGSALEDLDHGVLPELIDSRLRTLVRADPITRAAMDLLRLETIEPGRSWRVSYLATVQVVGALSATDGGTLGFSTARGVPIAEKAFSANAVAATTAALAAGKAGGMLTAVLSAPGAYTVTTGATVGTAKLTKIVARLVLTYTPATLTVAALTYQSAPDQDDLTASPRNRNLAAYERLRDTHFPWTLPLNLPLEETRALLDRAGYPRRQLLELWLSAKARTSPHVAYELLGLSPRDVSLLTNAAIEPEIWTIWGLEPDNGVARIVDASTGGEVSGPPATVLSRLSVLMQQAGLTYDELLEVLATRFVKAVGVAPTVRPRTECRPSHMSLAPLNPAFFDRVHRFVRLWRALGWAPAEVDDALLAFADAGEVTPATLLRLAHVLRLREAFGLNGAELVSWWRPPPVTPGPPGSVAADHRIADLARALGLSSVDYHRALAVTGIDPFASPEAALELHDAIGMIRDSGFSVRELCYLSRHRLDIRREGDEPLFGEAGLAIALSDAQVADVLTGFRAAVAAVREQAGIAAPDPSESLGLGLTALGWYP